MRKISVSILLSLILTMCLGNVSFGESLSNIDIIYFGTETCITCQESNKDIDNILKNKIDPNVKVNIKRYDISDKSNEELFWKYSSSFEVEDNKMKTIPSLFIGSKALVGKEEIANELESTLNNYINNPNEYVIKDINENRVNINYVKMSLLSIFIGGLLDGINPCSISMMLFFVSFAVMSEKKGNLIIIGLSFSLGTFIAYYGIGVGLLSFMYKTQSIKYFAIAFYVLLIMMSIYLSILNIKDYIAIKKGDYGDIKNQLSSKTKSKIHQIIKDKVNNKMLYAASFVSAFVISFFEFFCTGQIYLPMITYMINLKMNLITNYMLLGLYNLAFISPLLIITFALSIGKNVIDISQLLLNKMDKIKAVGAIFFVIVAILTSLQLFKMM